MCSDYGGVPTRRRIHSRRKNAFHVRYPPLPFQGWCPNQTEPRLILTRMKQFCSTWCVVRRSILQTFIEFLLLCVSLSQKIQTYLSSLCYHRFLSSISWSVLWMISLRELTTDMPAPRSSARGAKSEAGVQTKSVGIKSNQYTRNWNLIFEVEFSALFT